MSDDSGLEINLLNNQPGIYSARWGGKKNNFDLAIKKVFKKLDKKVSNWRNRKINAKFICALTIYWPSGKYVKQAASLVDSPPVPFHAQGRSLPYSPRACRPAPARHSTPMQIVSQVAGSGTAIPAMLS